MVHHSQYARKGEFRSSFALSMLDMVDVNISYLCPRDGDYKVVGFSGLGGLRASGDDNFFEFRNEESPCADGDDDEDGDEEASEGKIHRGVYILIRCDCEQIHYTPSIFTEDCMDGCMTGSDEEMKALLCAIRPD